MDPQAAALPLVCVDVFSMHISRRLKLALSVLLRAAAAKKAAKQNSRRQVPPRIPSPKGVSKHKQHRAIADAPAQGKTLQHESPQQALHAAARSGDVRAASAVYAALPAEQAPELLAEVTNAREQGRTPLSVACERGHPGMVRLLLSKGADTYAYDDETNTSPLIWACTVGNAQITAMLLAEGEADAFHLSANGRTAAIEAAKGGFVGCLECLLHFGIDVRQSSEDGRATHPMLEAAEHGHLEALKILMGAPGAKINQTDKAGYTALYFAARNGDVRMLEVLLAAGAKSIPEFTHLRTPLHVAALHNHLPAALILLRAQGANGAQARDRDGKTPADLTGNAMLRAALRAALCC